MTPREAFFRYARKAFRVKKQGEGTAVFLSPDHEVFYQAFVESLRETAKVDDLVELLALETPQVSRDVRYELWIAVLRRIREILGGDQEAVIAEVLVHLMYGEDDDAAAAWEDLRQIYPGDPEVLKVGLCVAAVNRDEEALKECLEGLRAAEAGPRRKDLETLLAKKDWRGIQATVRYNPRRNAWFERAAQARANAGRRKKARRN
jgi:hypothetical protein